MNKNTIHDAVLLCEQQIERRVDGLRSGNSLVQSANIIERQLMWASCRPDDWEILVYKQNEDWEVCFFRWPLHHEHATGYSFDSVRKRAEQRIRTLEAGRLRATNWRRPAAVTSGRADGLR